MEKTHFGAKGKSRWRAKAIETKSSENAFPERSQQNEEEV